MKKRTVAVVMAAAMTIGMYGNRSECTGQVLRIRP